jgi:hypothetical protein
VPSDRTASTRYTVAPPSTTEDDTVICSPPGPVRSWQKACSGDVPAEHLIMPLPGSPARPT